MKILKQLIDFYIISSKEDYSARIQETCELINSFDLSGIFDDELPKQQFKNYISEGLNNSFCEY